MKRIGRSFIWTICLALGFFIMIVGFIFYVFYSATLRDAYEIGHKATENIVYASSSFLRENMDIVGLQAETIDYMLSNGGDATAITQFMQESTNGYKNSIDKDFGGFYGYINGQFIDGVGWDPGDSYNPSNRPWYKEAVAARGNTIITSPYLDKYTGKIMISIASSLSDTNNVVAVDISLDTLNSIINDMATSVNGECFILDECGMVVTSSIEDRSVNYLNGQAGTEKKKLAEKVFSDAETQFDYSFEGKKSIVFTQSFVGDWHAVLVLDKSVIFKDSYLDLTKAILASLILVIVLLLFCNYSYRKRMDAEDSLAQVKAVSAIYVAVDDIDILKNTFEKISNAEHIEKLIGDDTNDAQGALHRVLNSVVTDEYAEAINNFIDLSTISERMKGKYTITCEFVGKVLGWCSARFIAVETDEEDRPVRVLIAIQNINQEKTEQQRLISESTVDGLTGCFNRRAYEDTIIEYKKHMPEKLTFVSMDLNGLKAVNDDLGHAAGDELIIGAADCMKDVLREYGKVYRIGGDEFVSILETDEDTSIALIASLRNLVYEWQGEFVDNLSLSIGFVTKDGYPNLQIEELAKVADKLMYEDKAKHYKMMGIDRRAQKDAYDAICDSYTKIIECNLSFNSYRIIKLTEGEDSPEKGFRENLSDWLREFAVSSQVHPEDKDLFLENTNLDKLREYSKKKSGILSFQYRRIVNGEYKNVVFEMIPSKKFNEENQIVFINIKTLG